MSARTRPATPGPAARTVSARRAVALRRHAFAAVARHEWRLLRADRVAWLAALVLAVAVAMGAVSGARWVAFQARAIAAGREAEARQFAELRARADSAERAGQRPGPFDVYASPGFLGMFYPRYAAADPTPLAALSVGQSDVYPYYFRISGERRDSFIDAEEIEHPLNLLTGRFDLAFAIVYVLPLVALALSYGMLAAEREAGTLRLALAQPVRPGTLLAAKGAVRVALLVGATVAAAPLALAAAGVDLAAPGALPRLATWVAAVAAYALVWVALAALVNTLRIGAAASAVALGAVWVAWTFVVPAFLAVGVAARHPVPPRAALIAATRDADTRVGRPRAVELLEAYYAAHPGTKPPGLDVRRYDFPLYWTAVQGEVDRVMAPTLARYDAARDAQQRLVDRLRVLSPALVAQEAMNDLAGTGVVRHRRFLAAVDAFHADHRAFFAPRTYAKQAITAADYGRMPRFRFADEPTGAVVARAAAGIATLLVIAGTLALVALARARRLTAVD